MTEQDIKDWLAQNPGASDTLMAQTARQNMVDPGMIARATGVPVTDVYSRMAAVPQQQPMMPQQRPQTQLPSYNTFLDNLMSSMGASGGMMGFDMPALATSTYVRPTFGNLNDVRTQAEAAYKAKKAAEEAAKQEAVKQAIEQYVASGGDLGMLTGNGYNGFGPSATSYTGYSDALAAKGQTSGVPVEDRGSYSGSVSGWSGISDTNTNADTNSSSVYGQGGFL